ncbi:MAG TPA: tetratricopeptide repeat protein [Jatrophihabitans sp.]|jgi:putative thioredoxin
MAGAVDLAAVKARADAQARAERAPGPAPSQTVQQITEANFQAEVLDRSFQVPVLVVFYSPRSQASSTLIADLTPLIQQQDGALVLAVLDAETEARIAQAMQVQGVPTVMAVIGGQLVPGFEGALPAEQLEQFVDAVLQAGAQAGLTGPNAPAEIGEDGLPQAPVDPRFDAAEEALADGDLALAEQRFQAILDVEPANADAKTALLHVKLTRRIAETEASETEAPADDLGSSLHAADVAYSEGDADSALRTLLDLLARVTGEDKDVVRERLLEFFELLGPEDERLPAARREMARALF